eukprot:3452310-Pyramimonas_sp.AAC.1
MPVDVSRVWSTGKADVPDFVPCWKYGKRLWVALGETHEVNGQTFFQLSMPIYVVPLTEFLMNHDLTQAPDDTVGGKRPRRRALRLTVRQATWELLDLARLDMDSGEEKDILPATKSKKKGEAAKKKQEGGEGEAQPDTGEEDDAGEDDVDLEGWLEELMEDREPQEEEGPEEEEDGAPVDEAEDKQLDEEGIDDAEEEEEEPPEESTKPQAISALKPSEEAALRER